LAKEGERAVATGRTMWRFLDRPFALRPKQLRFAVYKANFSHFGAKSERKNGEMRGEEEDVIQQQE